MAVRRLAETQPDSFAFSDDNRAWAAKEIAKYPEGRQASAVISLLWRAQEQEGWVSEPAIAEVAEMLDLPRIRVLEVATFYTMFQLAPVGTVAHVQVCGTTPCWLRGADDVKAVCKSRIHHDQHALSDDGAFSWEEVECLGSCVNAPMIQIGADTYEDLTSESFGKILDDLAAGREITPGPQIERTFAAPEGGITTLSEVLPREPATVAAPATAETVAAEADEAESADAGPDATPSGPVPDDAAPAGLAAAREGGADDLKLISGVGPKIEGILNGMGVFHFDQIASWTEQNIAWVDENLKFKGRIERENWIEQAKTLAAGGETEFSGRKTSKSDRG